MPHTANRLRVSAMRLIR